MEYAFCSWGREVATKCVWNGINNSIFNDMLLILKKIKTSFRILAIFIDKRIIKNITHFISWIIVQFKRVFVAQDDNVKYTNKVYIKILNNIKSIWYSKEKRTYGIERQFRIFISFLALLMPSTFIRYLLGFFKNRVFRRLGIEYYSFLKPSAILGFFWFDQTASLFFLILCVVLSLDTIHFLLTRIFLNDILKAPTNYRRSLILTFVNFLEVSLSFSFIYSYIDDANPDNFSLVLEKVNLNDFESIYLSFANAATIGYYTPSNKIAIIITITQTIISLFFIVVIFTYVMNGLNSDSQ